MRKFLLIFEGILQMLIGIGGVVSGFLMMIDPSGGLMTMPLELIASTPFPNYFIPGVILFFILGIGNVISSILCFKKHTYAGYAGVLFGFALITWIIVQISMIGLLIWLQSLYLVLGIIELTIGIVIYVNREIKTGAKS